MKILAVVFMSLIALLGYDIYFGKNGLQQYYSMQDKLEDAQKISEKLKLRNQAVVDEIVDLKQGNRVIEEIARSELGMVKPGETFYRVIDKAEEKK